MFVDNFVVKSWMGLLIELQNISKEPVHMDIIPYGMAAFGCAESVETSSLPVSYSLNYLILKAVSCFLIYMCSLLAQ